MAGGAAEVLSVSLSCPSATPMNPPPFFARLLFVSGRPTSTRHPDGWRLTYFCLGSGVERAILISSYFQLYQKSEGFTRFTRFTGLKVLNSQPGMSLSQGKLTQDNSGLGKCLFFDGGHDV